MLIVMSTNQIINGCLDFLRGIELTDFFVGLISGIVSSLIVTLGFRFKDNRKDALMLMDSIARFICNFGDTFKTDQLDKPEVIINIQNYLLSDHRPKKYKWVILNHEEKRLHSQYSQIYSGMILNLQGIIYVDNRFDQYSDKERSKKECDRREYENNLAQLWRKMIKCQGEVLDYLNKKI